MKQKVGKIIAIVVVAVIVIGLLFYWCIDKKKGYYILSVGLIGTVINQFLKIVFVKKF